MTLSNQTGDQYLQSHIDVGDAKTALRVTDTTVSTNKLSISAESVSFTAGAAGTTGVVTLDKAPIFNSDGGKVGQVDSTSFAWVTGTILVTEVAFNHRQTDAVQLAAMANGEYAIDYDLGRIRYKKNTTGTSDTCNYTSRQLNVELTAGGDIEIGAVELKDGTTDARAEINAANTARTTSTNVVVVQVIDENGSVVGGSTGPSAPQAVGTLASGTDAYQTVVATTAARSHIKVSLAGANDAIVSIDSGVTDHIYVQANSEVILDDLLIATTKNIQAKNAVGGSNHSKLAITVW